MAEDDLSKSSSSWPGGDPPDPAAGSPEKPGSAGESAEEGDTAASGPLPSDIPGAPPSIEGGAYGPSSAPPAWPD